MLPSPVFLRPNCWFYSCFLNFGLIGMLDFNGGRNIVAFGGEKWDFVGFWMLEVF